MKRRPLGCADHRARPEGSSASAPANLRRLSLGHCGSQITPRAANSFHPHLAAELGVSRLPVLNAYAQLLAEGYFESRVGSGTLVCVLYRNSSSRETTGATRGSCQSPPDRGRSRSALRIFPSGDTFLRRGWGAFGVGQVAFDQFPFQIWSGLVARHSRGWTPAQFTTATRWLQAFQETIATYLRTARAVPAKRSRS